MKSRYVVVSVVVLLVVFGALLWSQYQQDAQLANANVQTQSAEIRLTVEATLTR